MTDTTQQTLNPKKVYSASAAVNVLGAELIGVVAGEPADVGNTLETYIVAWARQIGGEGGPVEYGVHTAIFHTDGTVALWQGDYMMDGVAEVLRRMLVRGRYLDG